jgi:hypothetical protein
VHARLLDCGLRRARRLEAHDFCERCFLANAYRSKFECDEQRKNMEPDHHTTPEARCFTRHKGCYCDMYITTPRTTFSQPFSAMSLSEQANFDSRKIHSSVFPNFYWKELWPNVRQYPRHMLH